MKRSQNINRRPQLNPKEASWEIAIHEAGHAAAIYFGNKQNGLPPVYFKIYINQLKRDIHLLNLQGETHHKHVARIEGGRLIHTLPSSLDEATKDLSDRQKLGYERAFEADIINLLIGPLAEAKYISLRDGELINHRLVDLNALHFYGGFSDLETINEYLNCFNGNEELKQLKIAELFLAAFEFIDQRSHWLAITALADYVLAADKNLIEYDEIIAVLEEGSRPARMPWQEPVEQAFSHGFHQTAAKPEAAMLSTMVCD